jgi:hypothetical protein
MDPDEQAIRDLVAEWERATLADDLDSIARLMADDVVFPTAGNPPMRGRDAFLAVARALGAGAGRKPARRGVVKPEPRVWSRSLVIRTYARCMFIAEWLLWHPAYVLITPPEDPSSALKPAQHDPEHPEAERNPP